MRRAKVEQLVATAVTEAREDGYTAGIVAAAQSAAAGTGDASVTNTGAAEIAARFVSFGLAHAEVAGDGMDACVLGDIGRDIVRRGHSLWRPRPSWWRACGYDVTGSADPDTWTYALDFPAPSQGTSRRHFSASGVCNFRWGTDPERPWAGVSPLVASGTAGIALAWLELRLSQELKARVGNVLSYPDWLTSEQTDQFRSDLGKLEGETALVEGTRAAKGQTSLASHEYAKTRLGANPPEVIAKLHAELTECVLLTVLPPALVRIADGTSLRESFRQLVAVTLRPLARIIEAECERVGIDITLDFEGLRSDDVQGRARAFMSMVTGGMDPRDAADNAGLNMAHPPVLDNGEG